MQFYNAYDISEKKLKSSPAVLPVKVRTVNPSKEAYYPAKKPPRKYVLINKFWKENCLNGGLRGSKLACVNAFLRRPHWPA